MKEIKNIHNIEGPVGNLEYVCLRPDKNLEKKAIAVICHPHPLYGGSLNNKVVHTLAKGLLEIDIPSIRFNFRGVGQSEGTFDQGIGEKDDLQAIIEWSKAEFPSYSLILAGFSFGAFVSAMHVNHTASVQLISIAPPIDRFDFSTFEMPDCDWLVLMGDEDEVVSFEAVSNWLESMEKSPSFVKMEGASHFFHGRLLELKSVVQDYFADQASYPLNFPK